MSQKTLLIVDDVESLRDVLASVLKDEGYNVFMAGNGKEGLMVLAAQKIDLLITDIFMPEMDGFELSMGVRNNYPQTKLIIISGGGTVRSGARTNNFDAIQAGQDLVNPDSILKKPFAPSELIELVATVLGE